MNVMSGRDIPWPSASSSVGSVGSSTVRKRTTSEDGGTILSAGFQNLAALPITVLRVVGGTGDFKNARGQTMLDFAEGTVTFKLVP